MIRPGDRVTVAGHSVSIVADKPPVYIAPRTGVVRDVGDRFATVDYDDDDLWGYMVELSLLVRVPRRVAALYVGPRVQVWGEYGQRSKRHPAAVWLWRMACMGTDEQGPFVGWLPSGEVEL